MIKVFNGSRRGLGGESEELFLQLSFSFREQLHNFKGAPLAVFMAICLHSNQDGKAWPSYSLLEKETGYDRAAIAKAITDLCALKIDGHRVLCRYQEVDDNGQFTKSNIYRIFPSVAEAMEADLLLSKRPKIVTPKRTKPDQPGTSGAGSLESELVSDDGDSLKSELPLSLESELGGSLKSELKEELLLELDPVEEKPGGNTPIQDHPSQPANEPPPPTAVQPEKPATAVNPGKPEDPKPMRGDSQTATVAQPEQPFVVKPGEYLPGIPDPRHRVNGQATKLEGLTKKNEQRGIAPELFKEIVDAYLDETDQLSTANSEGTYANRALTDAQEFVDTLLGQGKRFWSATAMRTLFRSWEADNKGLKIPPSAKQVLAQAERIVKGKAGNSLFVPAGSTPAPTIIADYTNAYITDIPEPAPTADQAAEKAEKALEAERENLGQQLRIAVNLHKTPAKGLAVLEKWRNWNAAHPDKPVTLPKEWAPHVAA